MMKEREKQFEPFGRESRKKQGLVAKTRTFVMDVREPVRGGRDPLLYKKVDMRTPLLALLRSAYTTGSCSQSHNTL